MTPFVSLTLQNKYKTIQYKYNTNTIQIQYKYNTNTIQIQYKYKEDAKQIQFKYKMVMVRIVL